MIRAIISKRSIVDQGANEKMKLHRIFSMAGILVLTFFLLLIGFSKAESPVNLPKIAQQIGPSSVMVGVMDGNRVDGIGSGVWIRDKKGELYIVTNAHVIEGYFNDVKIAGLQSQPSVNKALLKNDPGYINFAVRLYTGSDLKEGDIIRAKLYRLPKGQYALSSFKSGHDLALLKPTIYGPLAQKIQTVQFRDIKQDKLQPLESVIAVGSPQDWSDTFTMGHISNPERLHPDELQNIFIQHDAPINGGNSGGGLYDTQGRLIGINSRKPPSIEEGVSFSIRVDVLETVLKEWGILLVK